MVCVPCFIYPVLLFIFHKFLQPLLLKYWNPWGTKDEKVMNEKVEKMLCKDGTCFRKKDAIVDSKESSKGELESDKSAVHSDGDNCTQAESGKVKAS